jgi:4-aminobutyrate aminotransferase
MNTFEKYRQFMITEFLGAIEPIVVAGGDGATLTDEAGRKYVDAFAGIAVCNAGHCNPEIAAAAHAQLDKLVHCGTYLYPHAPAADLAESLARILPGRLNKTFFASSGAEANETAIRLAKQFTGATEFLALHGAFHGRSLATLSLSGLASRKRGGGPYMPGVAFAPAPYCYRCALDLKPETCGLACAEMIEDILRCATSGDAAALIAEPIQGEGGIIAPPKGYFSAVKQILDRRGLLLILDEVQTGFCRTGAMFAMEHEGIEPDMITLGKGIANGLPLSAMVTRREIAAAFKAGDHLSTFGGNPVCCAAALAAIGFYQRERLAERSREKGEWLAAELRRRLEADRRVGEIRGRGLMIGIELVKDLSKAPAPELAGKVRALCRESGVLVGIGGIFGNVIRIEPPLVIGDDQLAQVADALCAALSKTGEGL